MFKRCCINKESKTKLQFNSELFISKLGNVFHDICYGFSW